MKKLLLLILLIPVTIQAQELCATKNTDGSWTVSICPPSPTPTPTPVPTPTPAPTPTPTPVPSPTPSAFNVVAFELQDANGLMYSLNNGTQIVMGTLPEPLLVYAYTNPGTVGSVLIKLGPLADHTENNGPYTSSSFTLADLGEGTHQLTATPYSEANLGGTQGGTLSITFEVVAGPSPSPSPTPSPTPSPSPSPSPSPTPSPIPVPECDFYAGAGGSASGTGSLTSPWDLQTAINKSSAAGKVICGRGTVGNGFASAFSQSMSSTASAPTILKAYPPERFGPNRFRINGTITISGAYFYLWDVEVFNSNTDRTSGSNRPAGITMFGRGSKVINAVIHDTGHPGIGFWNSVGDGGEVYGLINWGTGSYNGEAGSGIYGQNTVGTRYIRDSIFFKNIHTGFKAFTTGTHADGFHVEGNTSFQNGEWDIFTVSRNFPMERLKMLSNMTYKVRSHPEVSYQFGYENDNDPSKDIVVTDNYFAGGNPSETAGRAVLHGRLFTNVNVQRNTVVGPNRIVSWFPCLVAKGCDPAGFAQSYVWDNNTYHNHTTVTSPFRFSDSGRTFPAWKTETGFDANSTYTVGRPPNAIFVRRNLYEPGRANITVYNWELNSTVQADISGIGLVDGDQYEVRDAQNFYAAPVLTGTYSSASPTITLPMTGLTAAPFIGSVPTVSNAHTAPEFAVFVVLKK